MLTVGSAINHYPSLRRYVQVRANGTNLRLNNCVNVERKVCDVLDEATAEKFNCKEDHVCTRLHKMHRYIN